MKKRSKICINESPTELEVKYEENKIYTQLYRKSIGGFSSCFGCKYLAHLTQTKAGARVNLNYENPNQLFLACLLILLSPGFLSSVPES